MDVVDGVAGILDLFDEYPIVALGEMHGVEQGARFIEDLFRDSRFADRPMVVVVEFGNSRYQEMCDAYVVGGEDVPLPELRRIWFDFARGGPWGFRAPIYPAFFATAREVNRHLPSDRRIRVLLGDPPVDWSSLHTSDALLQALGNEDLHQARIAQDAWLQQGKRVLVVAGTYHLMRRCPTPPWVTERGLSIVELLERDHSGSTFVVHPHSYLGGDNREEIERKLATWSVPSLARLAGTELGELPAETFFGWQLTGADGKPYSPFAASRLRLSDVVDAFLYLVLDTRRLHQILCDCRVLRRRLGSKSRSAAQRSTRTRIPISGS
jgi:hypothetical protein